MHFHEIEIKLRQDIASLKAQADAGTITESQYQESVYNMLNESTIEQSLNTTQPKVAAAKLVRAMCKLAGVPPK